MQAVVFDSLFRKGPEKSGNTRRLTEFLKELSVTDLTIWHITEIDDIPFPVGLILKTELPHLMKFRDLDIPDKLKDALEEKGFVEMYPPQAEAIPKALTGKNLVAAVPTASGKSMIGFIPAMNMVLRTRRKVLYIVPLKALASEKRDDLEEFSKILESHGHDGFKVIMTTGDPDRDDDVSSADIVIATSEKADSMIRHGNRWIEGLGLVIADEVHMIHEPGRGPTLEIAITKFMHRISDLQVIALSATISNSLDLALWLDAEHVKMDWRPTKLKNGVYLDGTIHFDDGSDVEVPPEKEPIWGMIKQTVEEGGQCIVFVNSRRSTESVASKFAKKMAGLTGTELSDVDKILLEGGDESTPVGKKLCDCVSCGIAFHHAGLDYGQRRTVEEGFRNRTIKCIVATPTLAAGINLPARRVIVRDTTRFESNMGNTDIPVMEIRQMCGRAGRPGYDPWGEAVLMAKSFDQYDHLFDTYIWGDTEQLVSKLGDEKVLRSHILGLIATGDAETEGEIVSFLGSTFYGATTDMYGAEEAVSNVVDFLAEQGMIERIGDNVRILPFGKRTSDLYIDPWTAVILKKAVMKMTEETDEFQIMQAIACTPDIMGMYPKKDDAQELEDLDGIYSGKYLCSLGDECGGDDYSDMSWDIHMADLKTALVLKRWIQETPEETLTEILKIGPGDIRSRVDSANWILYAMNEIALTGGLRPECTKIIRPLVTHIKYGVKEELVPLVSYRGVGRNRARTLFDNGVRTRQDILNIDVGKLAALPKIGRALAESLKKQAGYVPKVVEEPERDTVDDEMEYMLERMNAEEEARKTQTKKTAPEAKKKQMSIDSF